MLKNLGTYKYESHGLSDVEEVEQEKKTEYLFTPYLCFMFEKVQTGFHVWLAISIIAIATHTEKPIT